MPSSLFAALLCPVLVALAPASEPGAPIVIDGSFDDWADVTPAVVDPADAPDSPIDFGAVACQADGQFVHFLIALGREINIQSLSGRGLLVIDADGDARTGLRQFGLDGVDIIVEMTPPSPREPGKPGVGFGLRSTTYNPEPSDPDFKPLNPYDAGLTFAPTYASDRTELRLRRGVQLPGTAPLFAGARFSARLVALDASQQIRDQTVSFTSALPTLAVEPVIDQQGDPLIRASGTSLRIMSWNSELGAIFKKPDIYCHILSALAPDVIHFQEMPQARSDAELEALLNRITGDGDGRAWHVIWGAGGGDLRCAIASRIEAKPVEALNFVACPDQPDHAVRVAGALIDDHGRRLMLVAIHLKCCGSAGSPEDQMRVREVELIRSAIDSAMTTEHVDGVVISGDFNLVGSRLPLDELVRPPHDGDAALTVLNPLQIDGRSNGTWSDRKQPFVPGRLDYMLYGGAVLKPLRSFVFDSTDLSDTWLARHGIMARDSEAASDHLPLVADFAWSIGAR